MGFLPFGFVYPDKLKIDGIHYEYPANPDPKIEVMRERMRWLNEVISHCQCTAPVAAAALDRFQELSISGKKLFWANVMTNTTAKEIAAIVDAIAEKNGITADYPLEFPNAIALVDCRFVDTTEWEHLRRYSIGGSDAATILGQYHYQSPRSIFYDKTGVKIDPLRQNDWQRQHILDFGHNVEDHVVDSFAAEIGAKRIEEHRMFAMKEYPFLTCNPDGLLLLPDGTILLFEAKTAFRMKIDEWKIGIPCYYAPQPAHYFEVFNDPRINKGFIGVCLGGNKCDRITHDFVRDPVAGAAQTLKLVEYWENYIVAGVEPPLTGDPELDHAVLYDYVDPSAPTITTPTPVDPAELPADADIEALIAEYKDLGAKRKALSKDANALKASEELFARQISDAVPDGEWTIKKENSMTYLVKKKENKKKWIDYTIYDQLPSGVKNRLSFAARQLGSVKSSHTNPSVK